jgi:hypothetical protein
VQPEPAPLHALPLALHLSSPISSANAGYPPQRPHSRVWRPESPVAHPCNRGLVLGSWLVYWGEMDFIYKAAVEQKLNSMAKDMSAALTPAEQEEESRAATCSILKNRQQNVLPQDYARRTTLHPIALRTTTTREHTCSSATHTTAGVCTHYNFARNNTSALPQSHNAPLQRRWLTIGWHREEAQQSADA